MVIPLERVSNMFVLIYRISEMLHNFFKLFSETNKIGICATSESVEKLNKKLFSSRGSHLFKNLHAIAELSKASNDNLNGPGIHVLRRDAEYYKSFS